MADTLPSPPESRSVSPSTNQEEENNKLSKQLDELLEQYLELLDTYTKLREDLSKKFSAGFFSLAQAQRTSTLGAGRRYGQECYDQRMKAQSLVRIEGKDSRTTSFHVKRRLVKQKVGVEESLELVAQKDKKESVEISAEISNETDLISPAKAPPKAKQDPALRDPLTWFGILAPPSLRQTQSTFSKASEETIPALLTVESDMRQLEDRIWTLRAELNLMSEYGSEDVRVDPAIDDEDVDGKVALLSLAEGARSPASRMPKFSGRSTHSKSTLLKLGE